MDFLGIKINIPVIDATDVSLINSTSTPEVQPELIDFASLAGEKTVDTASGKFSDEIPVDMAGKNPPEVTIDIPAPLNLPQIVRHLNGYFAHTADTAPSDQPESIDTENPPDLTIGTAESPRIKPSSFIFETTDFKNLVTHTPTDKETIPGLVAPEIGKTLAENLPRHQNPDIKIEGKQVTGLVPPTHSGFLNPPINDKNTAPAADIKVEPPKSLPDRPSPDFPRSKSSTLAEFRRDPVIAQNAPVEPVGTPLKTPMPVLAAAPPVDGGPQAILTEHIAQPDFLRTVPFTKEIAPIVTIPRDVLQSDTAVKIAQQITVNITKSVEPRIELRLDPPELGRVIVNLTPSEHGVNATITAERPEIADLMRRHADILSAAFEKAGFGQSDLQFQSGNQNQGDQQSTTEGLLGPDNQKADPIESNISISYSSGASLDIRL